MGFLGRDFIARISALAALRASTACTLRSIDSDTRAAFNAMRVATSWIFRAQAPIFSNGLSIIGAASRG